MTTLVTAPQDFWFFGIAFLVVFAIAVGGGPALGIIVLRPKYISEQKPEVIQSMRLLAVLITVGLAVVLFQYLLLHLK